MHTIFFAIISPVFFTTQSRRASDILLRKAQNITEIIKNEKKNGKNEKKNK